MANPAHKISAMVIGVLAISLSWGCSSHTPQDITRTTPSQSAHSTHNKQATTVAHSTSDNELKVAIRSLSRTSAGHTLLRLRLTNLTGAQYYLIDYFAIERPSKYNDISGVTLINTENHKRYYSLRDMKGRCICSRFENFEESYLEPKETISAYVYFPRLADSIHRVAVSFPYTPPWTGVPVRASAGASHRPKGNHTVQPTDAHLAPPHIASIAARSEALNGSRTIREGADRTRVTLSADVLFALNKAKLTPEAEQELKKVAKRINESHTGKVHIDGYTDSTGGSEINDPLSRDRARSVQTFLRPLISSREVAFKVAGHGASNPVASNATKKGRQRNRRVVITIRK